MALRDIHIPYGADLSYGLKTVLHKNGINGHIWRNDNGSFQLVVQGHDSPQLVYNITDRQAKYLAGWGSGFMNRRAYETFTNIVKSDFQIPLDYVTANNAFVNVTTGLHGYRIGGQRPPLFALYNNPFGTFMGYHLRRDDGQLRFAPGGMIIPERPNGYLKPGEMASGAYGFYYKGNRQSEVGQDKNEGRDSSEVLIDARLQPAKRENGRAVPYSDEITTPVYFTQEKFLNILKSHGLEIDTNSKTLVVKSSATRVNTGYELTQQELNDILSLDKKKTLDDRLKVLNNVIVGDFKSGVTKEMLESKNLVNIEFRDDVKAVLEKGFIEQEREAQERASRVKEQRQREQEIAKKQQEIESKRERINNDPHAVYGRDIALYLSGKDWFNPEKHGRRIQVEEIWVEKTAGSHYLMRAEINGHVVSHSISEKDYQKFTALEDAHKMKMFDHIFDEVKIGNGNTADTIDDVYMITDAHGKSETLSNVVDGQNIGGIAPNKGFYTDIRHGRELEIGQIEIAQKNNGKFEMSAYIDGQRISHEITEKQYNKFIAVDDYQRLKLFDKVFDEVKMKTRPGEGHHIGAAILAGLTATAEILTGIGSIARPRPLQRPDVYMTSTVTPVYFKPGVVSPADVAAMQFGAAVESREMQRIDKGLGL